MQLLFDNWSKMWYWDYFPPSGKYAKKPLTKEQLKKIQENYARGNEISEHVKKLEEKDREQKIQEIEDDLEKIFL